MKKSYTYSELVASFEIIRADIVLKHEAVLKIIDERIKELEELALEEAKEYNRILNLK